MKVGVYLLNSESILQAFSLYLAIYNKLYADADLWLEKVSNFTSEQSKKVKFLIIINLNPGIYKFLISHVRIVEFFHDISLMKVYTQKKYLIESKKLFVWKTFFDVKKWFVYME